jgi:hypothetical protein
MNFKMSFFIFVLIAAIAATALPAAAQRNDARGSVSNLPDRDRGPSFSSPPEVILDNGDVASHYPPYYHPEGDGSK